MKLWPNCEKAAPGWLVPSCGITIDEAEALAAPNVKTHASIAAPPPRSPLNIRMRPRNIPGLNQLARPDQDSNLGPTP